MLTKFAHTRTQESQTENFEAPGYCWKSNFHQPLLETFIIDTQNVFDAKIDANTQHYGENLSSYKYLADPGDIDQMYFADEDVEQQSTVAAETSLSYPTQSNILNIGTKDGLGDKESLPLSEDSSKVHQQIPVYGDVEKRYGHDPLLPQVNHRFLLSLYIILTYITSFDDQCYLDVSNSFEGFIYF